MTHTPDPHGQAALLLCESLLFLLVETGLINKDQIVSAIEGVIEVKREIAGTTESAVVSMASIGLLRAVSGSIAATAPRKSTLAS